MRTCELLPVVVISRQPLVLEGLHAVISGIPEFRSQRDVQAALTSRERGVVVFDVTEPDAHDLEALGRCAQQPHLVVVAFVREPRPRVVELALEAGAVGVITLASSVDEVADALRAALEGRRIPAPALDPAVEALSARELEVLRLIAAGRSNVEIGAELFLGMNTIKTYIRSAYRRIGVTSRTHAMLWCIDHGLSDPLVRTHRSPDASTPTT